MPSAKYFLIGEIEKGDMLTSWHFRMDLELKHMNKQINTILRLP